MSIVTCFVAHQPVKILPATASYLWRTTHEPTTVEQGSQNLPDGQIECIGVEKIQHIICTKLKPGIGAANRSSDISMLDHDAFGRPVEPEV